MRRMTVLAGMLALAATSGAPTASAVEREYFVAAEDVVWDFAPTRRNLVHGGRVPQPWRKTRYRKTRYVEYTDATFSVPKPQPSWLGVLGPILRAEVGDTMRVHFANRSGRPAGIHPHGVRYDKDNEGAHYLPAGAGARIPPGGDFTYRWIVDEASGPGPGDPSSIVWWYHAHVNEPRDVNAGLLGPIIVTARGAARPDATPLDADREFVLLFMIFDEDHGRERGLMHGINGYIFGNLQGLEMGAGERVRWYLLALGNEVDLHGAHWHGRTVLHNLRRTDVIELLPGSMATADMVADNPGTWMIHCHVSDHIDAGMLTTYTVAGSAGTPVGGVPPHPHARPAPPE